jgi:hypothetical protein
VDGKNPGDSKKTINRALAVAVADCSGMTMDRVDLVLRADKCQRSVVCTTEAITEARHSWLHTKHGNGIHTKHRWANANSLTLLQLQSRMNRMCFRTHDYESILNVFHHFPIPESKFFLELPWLADLDASNMEDKKWKRTCKC